MTRKQYAALTYTEDSTILVDFPKAVYEVDSNGKPIGKALAVFYGQRKHEANSLAAELNRREEERQTSIVSDRLGLIEINQDDKRNMHVEVNLSELRTLVKRMVVEAHNEIVRDMQEDIFSVPVKRQGTGWDDTQE